MLKKVEKEEVVDNIENKIATEEMANQAEADFKKKLDEFSKHQFLLRLDENGAANLLQFLKEDAIWKFRQAYGIKDCVERIESSLGDIDTNKGIYLNNVQLEAIGFFLQNVETTGYEKAVRFVSIFDRITEVMQSVMSLHNELEETRKIYYAYANSFEQQIPISDTEIMKADELELRGEDNNG